MPEKKSQAPEKEAKTAPITALKPKKQRADRDALSRKIKSNKGALGAKDILELQRTIGNRAVEKLFKGITGALMAYKKHPAAEKEDNAGEARSQEKELIVRKKNEIERIFYELGNNIVKLEREEAETLETWLLDYSGDNAIIYEYATYYELKGKGITGPKERIWGGLKCWKIGKKSLEELTSLLEAYKLINTRAQNQKAAREARLPGEYKPGGMITDEKTEKEYLISSYAAQKPAYRKVGVLKPQLRAGLNNTVMRLLEKIEDAAGSEHPASPADKHLPVLNQGVDELRNIIAKGDGKDIGELGIAGFIYLVLHLDRPEKTGFNHPVAALRQLKFMLE